MFNRGDFLLYQNRFYTCSAYTVNGLCAYPVTLHEDSVELGTEREDLPGAEPITFVLVFNGTIHHTSLSNSRTSDHKYDLSDSCFLGTLDRIDSAFQCGVCGNQYRYETHLRRHMLSHEENETNGYCPCCTQQFSHHLGLALHRGRYCPDVQPHIEAQIDRSCRLKAPNGLTYFQCIKCDGKFRTADDFLNHVAVKREISYELDSILGLLRERKDKKPLLLCNSCLFPTETAQDAVQHLKIHTMASAIATREFALKRQNEALI